MDLQSALLQALKAGGGLHFLTTFLLERWRKKNDLQPDPKAGLQYPTSTSDTGWIPFPSDPLATPGLGPQAGFAYTLYSFDSNLPQEASLSLAAALLSPSGAPGTSTPSTPALAGGALPLALGFLVGNTLAS